MIHLPRLMLALSIFSASCVSSLAQTVDQATLAQTIEPSPMLRHYDAGLDQLITIWDIFPSPSGTLLMAGDFWLCEYDGHQFRRLFSPSVFSVAMDPRDSTVYVGAMQAIGYLTQDEQGKIGLHTLNHLLPDSIQTPPIRQVIVTKNKVFFLGGSQVFTYHKHKRTCEVYDFKSSIRKGFAFGDSLYVGDQAKGMQILYNNSVTMAPFGDFFKGNFFRGALRLPSGDHLLGWKDMILYDHTGKVAPAPYTLNPDHTNSTANAFASASAQNNLVVNRLAPGGATLFDDHHNKFFEYRGAYKFPALAVVSAGVDLQKNYWLGYYYKTGGALTKIESSQDIKTWTSESGLPGVLAMTHYKNELYLATSNGMYVMDAQHRLHRIPNTSGFYYRTATIWMNGQEKLLVSDNDGVKEWNGTSFNLLFPGVGEGYAILQTKSNPNRLILNGGTRTLSLLYQNGKWKEEYALPSLQREEKIQETPGGFIWIDSVRIDTKQTPFGIANFSLRGLQSIGSLSVSPKGNILRGSSNGIFELDEQKKQFSLWKDLGPELSDGFHDVSRILRISDSSYLISSGDIPSSASIVTFSKSGKSVVSAPFKRLPEKGHIECMWADRDGTVWIGGTFGLIMYKPEGDTKVYDQPFNCLIRKINIGTDSTVFMGGLFRQSVEKIHPRLSFERNQIHFEFAAPFFDKEEETLYAYRLKGQTETWSAWDKVYYKEFNNMGEGSYTFEVKAKNIYGKESRIASCSFEVLPPWYRTWWSYSLYSIAGFLFMAGVVRWRTASLRKKRMELEKIVSQQTTELREKNENLNGANEELRSTNEELNSTIEELNSTNDKLVTTQKQLVASEKMASLGQLTAGIAHEINNPINFISGGVQALDILHKELFDQGATLSPQELEERKQEIAQLMGSMTNGVMRTATIIKSLRQFSSPSETIGEEPVDIHESIENALLLLSSKLTDARVAITKECTAITKVKVNPAQISQVFINLIDNAIFALSEKNGDRTIRIGTLENAGNIIIIIADNGGGIPEAIQPRIFEPFYTTKEVGKGTGLGLFICYSIIQKHGGNIAFTSDPNGTSFEISIPTGELKV
ncbi:MAG: GHKL domain-containing protein [Bacteroidetes bacterium]|nr:GHKL domain-containing protein [Bacteroidota bacterium]